jgi:hypothetical protein
MVKFFSLGKTALIAVAMNIFSSPALADPPVGSRLGERLMKVDKQDRFKAVRKAHRLMECLANRRQPLAMRYLQAKTIEEAGQLNQTLFNSVRCEDSSEGGLVEESIVTLPDELSRGYVAEAIVKKDKGRFDLLPAVAPAAYARDWFSVTSRDPAVDEMSVCSVETNPMAVVVLLEAQPLSPEEGLAFAATVETLGKCLRVGAKLTGNKESLRASLAEALFHKLNPVEIAEAGIVK